MEFYPNSIRFDYKEDRYFMHYLSAAAGKSRRPLSNEDRALENDACRSAEDIGRLQAAHHLAGVAFEAPSTNNGVSWERRVWEAVDTGPNSYRLTYFFLRDEEVSGVIQRLKARREDLGQRPTPKGVKGLRQDGLRECIELLEWVQQDTAQTVAE